MTAELSTLVGLDAGTVRLAGFGSVMSSLVPEASALLAREHPSLEVVLTDTHPEDALELLRAGHVDIAVIFRYDDTAPEHDGIRLTHLLDDPLHLLTLEGGTTLAAHRESPWVGGCDRCRSHLVELCEAAGFSPRLAYTTDDMVVMQSLVAAGMGVTTIPGLALRAHRHPSITATPLDAPAAPDLRRDVRRSSRPAGDVGTVGRPRRGRMPRSDCCVCAGRTPGGVARQTAGRVELDHASCGSAVRRHSAAPLFNPSPGVRWRGSHLAGARERPPSTQRKRPLRSG